MTVRVVSRSVPGSEKITVGVVQDAGGFLTLPAYALIAGVRR